MKLFRLFPLLLLLLPFASCKDGGSEEAPKVKLNVTFRALYDGQPLEKYKEYAYGDSKLFYDRFNTYLSDLSLVVGGTKTKLSDIEWVDFTPDQATNNLAVEVKRTYEVPSGQYDAFSLGFGVKSDLNAKQPADFPAEHPLSRENEYWTGWKSYIFTKVQGRYDLNLDGTPEANVFYHTGSDAAYVTYKKNLNLNIQDDTDLVIEFDLKKLMTFNGQVLDLNVSSNRTTSHSADNVALGVKVMNNLSNATEFKL